MIQLNLLPDVKQQYISAQRQRRMLVSISLTVTIAALGILIILFGYDLAQRKHLSDLNHDIATESQQLKSKPNINTILTVQNQLESLTSLHAAKPASSRLFDTYLNQLTPASVDISSFHIDFTAQTATITGNSDTLSSVNQYVDTLKKTTFTTTSNSSATNAFSNVVLTSFSLDNSAQGSSAQPASYTISLSYAPSIFDITQDTVTLNVPSITTRADVNQPADLFEAAPASTTNGGGQ